MKAVCAAGFMLICAALITQWIWIMEIAALVKKRRGAIRLTAWLSVFAGEAKRGAKDGCSEATAQALYSLLT